MDNARPIHYKIKLEPDLERFRVSGTTEILLEASKPVDEITLNILELAIWNCKVKADADYMDCPFLISPRKEEMTVSLSNEMSGKIELRIDYIARINDKMAGFYRSQYKSQEKIKHIAVTQFEESDARRAFPCFDHPIRKATFEIEMIIDEGLVAISNCPAIDERSVGGGKKVVRFQQTPKMSTYLLFFGKCRIFFFEYND